MGGDLPVPTPAAALVPRRPPPALHLPLQKDKSTGISVQRAVHVRRLHAPFLALHLAATDGLTLGRDAADPDPDLGPSLDPHPDPDRLPRGFAVGSGEMFTAESPGSSRKSMR